MLHLFLSVSTTWYDLPDGSVEITVALLAFGGDEELGAVGRVLVLHCQPLPAFLTHDGKKEITVVCQMTVIGALI